MSMDPEKAFLCGDERQASLSALQLRAGPLSLVFDTGDLRYMRLDGREILRRVYFAVRDPEWLTLPTAISGLAIHSDDLTFRISFDAVNRAGPIDFRWRGTLEGSADGTVRFSVDGEAASSFLSNRIGICVLHPADECRGKPCIIEHVDGSTENSAFPDDISPHQPFVAVRAIRHEIRPGLSATVVFEGDVFETEDQRNWTDGSYKTYCPPLRGLLPREVRQGSRIAHSVTLSLRGNAPTATAPAAQPTVQLIDDAAGPLPRIGLGCSTEPMQTGGSEIGRLRRLNLAHLRADVTLSSEDWRESLRRATHEALEVGTGLELAVFLANPVEERVNDLAEVLRDLRPPIRRWLIFHERESSTDGKWVTAARQSLEEYGDAAPFGAGTNTFFAELNRGRNALSTADLLCYSMSPQVHASDNASMVEALQGQAPTVLTAKHFGGGLPVSVSPITLKPRFVRKTPTTGEPRGGLPLNVDIRQVCLFCAGWTAASLKHLARSGAQSLTYYETRGWRGILEGPEGSPAPDLFPSIPDSVFPVYHVFAWAGAFAGCDVLPANSSMPLRVEALAMRAGRRTRVILANLSPAQTEVSITGLARDLLVLRLNGTNVAEACRDPETFLREGGGRAVARHGRFETSLSPYELQRIDFDRE
jgi:D-apionolactonase